MASVRPGSRHNHHSSDGGDTNLLENSAPEETDPPTTDDTPATDPPSTNITPPPTAPPPTMAPINTSSSIDIPPTDAPSFSPTEPVSRSKFVSSLLDTNFGCGVVQAEGSPQQLAIEFIGNEATWVNVDDWNLELEQIYILTVLWYSLEGPSQWSNENWDSTAISNGIIGTNR